MRQRRDASASFAMGKEAFGSLATRRGGPLGMAVGRVKGAGRSEPRQEVRRSFRYSQTRLLDGACDKALRINAAEAASVSQ